MPCASRERCTTRDRRADRRAGSRAGGSARRRGAGSRRCAAEHYAAGDALHDKQGAFYAANAEVTRLEQQLAFARESETRIAQQVAQLTEAIGAIGGQEAALDRRARGCRRALAERAGGARTRRPRRAAPRRRHCRRSSRRCEAPRPRSPSMQQQIAQTEQAMRVAETRRDSAVQALAQLGAARDAARAGARRRSPRRRPTRSRERRGAARAGERRARRQAGSAGRAAADACEALQAQPARRRRDAWQRDSKRLADLEARQQALAALQAKIGHGTDIDGWLADHGLADARRLWQVLDIERAGRMRSKRCCASGCRAIELDASTKCIDWVADGAQPPRRIAAYRAGSRRAMRPHAQRRRAAREGAHEAPGNRHASSPTGCAACAAAHDLASALADRDALAVGEAFVTPAGHLVTAQGVTFFAPDNELHGVLARQRELDELERRDADGARSAPRRRARSATRSKPSSQRRSSTYHAEGLAVASQQRRVPRSRARAPAA